MPLPNQPTHAGGVVYRMRDGVPHFLLVTARRQPQNWVYPKGHIERGETCEATAAREVREEAGVDATVVGPLGDVRVRLPDEDQLIRYFLMRANGDGEAQEGRQSVWLPADRAVRQLTYDDARASLHKALAMLETKGLL